ncbi:M4 family metallopeptidase [Ideonella margarita]|uniref:Neutral metalloproteinase n=1 Tax=Ideonella margarita TaxID=2984191 RepID=A0ABU9C9T2_9BURK
MKFTPVSGSSALIGAVLALVSSTSNAADLAAAEARARGHIAAESARTMHDAQHSYAARDVIIDDDGTEHVRFDRQYKGLRVIGGDLVVHSHADGRFKGNSQTLAKSLRLSTQHKIKASEARAAAVAAHGGEAQKVSEKVIYARGDSPVLAWEVRVNKAQADGTPSELHVIVDAASGAVLESWDDIHTAAANGTGTGYFSGNVALTTDLVSGTYYLRDPSRGNTYTTNMSNGTTGNGTVFTDADNVWANGLLSNTATIGVDAQYGTAVTWDYYKNVHGRNGIANNGVGAYNRVHYSSGYNNAYWSDTCFCMTYGDGDGTTFNPFDSLDVAGHEMTHGVTSRTANLTYSGQSGGLNEATSDIFGTMVEYYAANANDAPDYKIGEKLYKSGTGALRYMYSPNLDGSSADCYYSTIANLDVHYSSGVANHFFFLLAEGTAGAGMPTSKTCITGNKLKATGTASLTGIGRSPAAKIWYRALTVYMTSSTTFKGARTATLKAATDLYGTGSTQYNAVAAAWSAVLVN